MKTTGNKKLARYRRMRAYRPRARRVRRYYAKVRRRASKAKIPLEVAAAGIAIPFLPARSDYSTSIVQDIQNQNWTHVGSNLSMGFAGIASQGGQQPNLFDILNPLNLEVARYTKMLIYAGLVHKVRTKLVKIPMAKVPFIGRYIS